VEFVLFEEAGKRVVTAGADRTVRAWNSVDAEQAKQLARFDSAITAWAMGEGSVFLGLADGRVTQRRLPKGEREREFTAAGDRITALAFHGPSQRLFIGTHGGMIRIWSLKDGMLSGEFAPSPGLRR